MSEDRLVKIEKDVHAIKAELPTIRSSVRRWIVIGVLGLGAIRELVAPIAVPYLRARLISPAVASEAP